MMSSKWGLEILVSFVLILKGMQLYSNSILHHHEPGIASAVVCRSQTLFTAQGLIACSISAPLKRVWGLDLQKFVQHPGEC